MEKGDAWLSFPFHVKKEKYAYTYHDEPQASLINLKIQLELG
jgi:hypothetical protein